MTDWFEIKIGSVLEVRINTEHGERAWNLLKKIVEVLDDVFAGPHVDTDAEDVPQGCDHTELQEVVTTEQLQQEHLEGWYPLTDKAVYRVKDGEIKIGFKRGTRVEPFLRVSINELKRLYDNLPDEADSSDVRRLMSELDIQVTPGFETYIMRVLANYVEFGGELIKEGRTLKLLKDSQFLREENRRKLRQELEVIGTEVNI